MEFQSVCSKRLRLWHQTRCRLRLLHRRSESTLSGLEVPSCRRCRHLKRCGSRRKNTMSPVHPSSTENAPNFVVDLCPDFFSLFWVDFVFFNFVFVVLMFMPLKLFFFGFCFYLVRFHCIYLLRDCVF